MVAFGHQPVCQVSANEARPTGDQYTH